MTSNVRMIESPRQSRKLRRPQHSFFVRQRPWQIQPVVIAPVLPGETMRNLLLQARVVTDPLANPLIGWWCEFYFFYVKHRDLAIRDETVAMMLEVNNPPTADSALVKTYHKGTYVDWTLQCLKRVTEEFFRNEGEAWDVVTLDNLPVASVNDQSWLDSMVPVADYAAADVELVDAATSDVLTASELDLAMRQWEFLKMNSLTTMDYEDFLRTYGVRPKFQELHRPELIRYAKGWTYPSNTIDPADGSPTSACSWAVAERADKDRFFSEPGFVFGVSVVRPKVYRANQEGSAVALLNTAMDWLPAILDDNPNTSVKTVDNGAGSPLENQTTDYVVDVKDLFLYGDQFLNIDPDSPGTGAWSPNLVELPTAAGLKRYASSTDANNLFVDADGSDGLNTIRMDGICSLTIASSLRETSGTT